jgi:hypothetical protein
LLDIEWREEKRERKRLRERGVLSGAGEEDEMGCTAGRETHTHTQILTTCIRCSHAILATSDSI